jgi:dihydropteroate synthase
MNPEEHTSAESPAFATVRLFASTGGQDLADELHDLGISAATLTAQCHMQTVAKGRVAAESVSHLEQVVAAFPTLVLHVQPGPGDDQTVLLIGPMSDLHACAEAIGRLHRPLQELGLEILRQLPWLFPPRYHTLQCSGGSLDFSVKTGIMGILNVTPDSFYDGGRYVDPQAAVDRAHQMVAEGADIIDIGGQSSRPGSDPVPEAEEAQRVLPVVQAVAKAARTIISVDTYRSNIARAALDVGAHLINDISALRFDPHLLQLVAERQVPLILMHMKGLPRTMHLNPTYASVVDEVYGFLQERLQTAQAGGVAADRLLVDPGIGFGKGARHNLEILRKLHHFRTLGRPIVIGTSRKSFIGRILGTEVHERLEGTAATVAVAIAQGASIIRVHDVQAMARVARMLDAMLRPNFEALENGRHGQDASAPEARPR